MQIDQVQQFLDSSVSSCLFCLFIYLNETILKESSDPDIVGQVTDLRNMVFSYNQEIKKLANLVVEWYDVALNSSVNRLFFN